MTIKETLIQFFQEKNVHPPITRRKIEKAGHQTSQFLLELKDRLKKAEDAKGQKPILNAYFEACKKLL